MTRRIVPLLLSLLFAAAWGAPVSAQGSNAEVIALVTAAEDKVVALANAMSDAGWAYRPSEGVRSSSEVFMHIAGANYLLPTMLGVMPPEDFPVTMGPQGPVGLDAYEATADRATVIAAVDVSFDHLRDALASVSPDRMDEELNVFGQTMTVRGFCIFMATHLHEHLGQLIAYARANEVVPPWSVSAGG